VVLEDLTVHVQPVSFPQRSEQVPVTPVLVQLASVIVESVSALSLLSLQFPVSDQTYKQLSAEELPSVIVVLLIVQVRPVIVSPSSLQV
jgi:hypothetical protein